MAAPASPEDWAWLMCERERMDEELTKIDVRRDSTVETVVAQLEGVIHAAQIARDRLRERVARGDRAYQSVFSASGCMRTMNDAVTGKNSSKLQKNPSTRMAEHRNAGPIAGRRAMMIDPMVVMLQAPDALVLPMELVVRRDSTVATLLAQMDGVIDVAQIAQDLLRERARWGEVAAHDWQICFRSLKIDNDARGEKERWYGIRFLFRQCMRS